MCSFQEKNFFSLSICGNVLTIQTSRGNFLMLRQMVLLPKLPNVNLLISKQNKTPKINPTMLKQ